MGDNRAGKGGSKQSLIGRTLYVPQMSHGGAVAFAASFRSAGINARPCPDSDGRTLELGGRHTSGEECLPARVTLGDLLKVTEQPDFVPHKTAFFMPTADGPCRFGQYATYIRKVLRDIGLEDVMVFSPTSQDGYQGVAEQVNELMRTTFRGLTCADILRKMLHKTRPYEVNKGDTDKAHAQALAEVEKALEEPGVPTEKRMKRLISVMTEARDNFRKVPAKYSRKRPLIRVVGEIFCRLTPFTNDNLIRKIEHFGGECSLAHIGEWIWYTNCEQQKHLCYAGKRFSVEMLGVKIKNWVQQRDEHRLCKPFKEDFRGYEEPHIHQILEYSDDYLPHNGVLGEMTLSVGKAISHYYMGCDGVVDISPFTCMNGIVTEAIYPTLSADHESIPVRNFFFDGTQYDAERDLGIFMELVRTYQSRKKIKRVYPFYFPSES